MTSRETEFARKLYEMMTAKGMSNSDLARAVWGETEPDKRGYRGARGRDRISVYLKGKAMPEPRTLAALAKALGCEPFELDPQGPARARPWEESEVSLAMIAGHPDLTLLNVNRVVPFELGAKIISLLAEHSRDADQEAKPDDAPDTNPGDNID